MKWQCPTTPMEDGGPAPASPEGQLPAPVEESQAVYRPVPMTPTKEVEGALMYPDGLGDFSEWSKDKWKANAWRFRPAPRGYIWMISRRLKEPYLTSMSFECQEWC